MIEDILKIYDKEKGNEKKRYSLSRLLLFITFIILTLTLTVPLFFPVVDNVELYNNIIDTMTFMLLIFAGYAFGSKVNYSYNNKFISGK